jgi:F-type H+-transporting ATPase subunit b
MLDFTWQSFAFAIINFLILAWLLNKMLHKPLLSIIEKRRRGIEEAQKAAAEERAKAQKAREEYEAKLSGIAQERDKVISAARESAGEDRERIVEKAREEARREVERLREAYKRESRETLSDLQQEIVDVSVGAACKVLEKVSDSDLDARLQGQLVKQLDGLTSEGAAQMPSGDRRVAVRVVSARALPDDVKQDVEERIRRMIGQDAPIDFGEDESLIAGTRVEFDTMIVDASLADVLEGVRESVGRESPTEAEAEHEVHGAEPLTAPGVSG